MKSKVVTNFIFLSPVIFCIVFILLGLITPNYDPLRRTISRLSIEHYGWIQQINFIQFAFGLWLSGLLISKSLGSNKSKNFIIRTFCLCATFMVLAAAFPINPVEESQFSFSLLTPTGIIHVLLVVLFVALSPFGIFNLYKIFHAEKKYENLARLTKFWGLTSCTMSVFLLFFIYYNKFSEYRGLFEKIIAMWVIIWLEVINLRALRNLGSK